jgi:hypothetical protein
LPVKVPKSSGECGLKVSGAAPKSDAHPAPVQDSFRIARSKRLLSAAYEWGLENRPIRTQMASEKGRMFLPPANVFRAGSQFSYGPQ